MTKLSLLHTRGSILILVAGIGALLFPGCDHYVSRQREKAFSIHGQSSGDRLLHGRISDSFGELPLSFEANDGQTDRSVDFVARGRGYTLFLKSNEAVLSLSAPRAASPATVASAIKLKLLNGSEKASAEPLAPLPGRSNYFIGNDPGEWRTNVRNYSSVRYRNVYPGIDVVYYGNQRQLEYDFVLAPRADPSLIEFAVEGADGIGIDRDGDLAISLGGDRMRLKKPVVYQESEGARRAVPGAYTIDDRGPVGFAIGEYDAELPLIIDPIVDYSSFYGGAGTDIAYGIAVDQQSNVYITGQTSSLNFPTKNPFSSTLMGANDAFVMKLNAQGNTVLFSTYIGGRNPGDRGWAIAVDRAGNVYFTGETTSFNFPTANAAQPNFRGGTDAFVVKLSIEGDVLLYSTFLGGSQADIAFDISLDRFDSAYITGRTESANFPMKDPLQPALRGQRDAFIAKLNADGEMVFSTYLGGEPTMAGDRDDEAGYGIATDALQNVYVTGFTASANFPLANPIQGIFGGVEDAFIAKLNPQASAIIYSTYLGGQRADNGRGIAVDQLGNAYVTGYTLSSDFPVANPLQPLYGGNGDGFVAKINPSGSALIYSTFLGGSGDENSGLISDVTPSCAIAIDSLGYAYVTGKTDSQNFPVVRAIQSALKGDHDAYVVKLDPAGSALVYSTYLGSTFTGNTGFDERGLGIAVDHNGSTCVTGQMLKNDFLTVLPVQGTYGGGLSDAFIAKISAPDIQSIAPVSAASFYGASLAPESIVAAFGVGLASGTEIAMTVPLPTSLLGSNVRVKDKTGVERPAPLFFVSPTQVNFQIPPGTPTGKATITITNAQTISVSATVWIENAAPGLFSANASGQGLAAAVALRVKSGGEQIFEPVVRQDEFGQLFPVPIDLGPETDQVFLILFGTGIRDRTTLDKVVLQIGGQTMPALYAGTQGNFVGQDQINVRLPRSLAGRGEVMISATVDGAIANGVSVNVR